MIFRNAKNKLGEFDLVVADVKEAFVEKNRTSNSPRKVFTEMDDFDEF